MEPPSAVVFILFGGLLMISWSRISREISWVLLMAIGAAALLSGSSEPVALVDGRAEPPGILPLDRISALMLFLTGLRIFSATRIPYLAPTLDGVIFGISLICLLGCSVGIDSLHHFGALGALSWLESLGFAVLSAMFLYADVEYARLNERARRLAVALGAAAFAATVSIRLADAIFASAGLDGFLAILGGQASHDVAVLAVLYLLVSLTIAAAVIFLMGYADNPNRLRRLRNAARLAEIEQFRYADCLNQVLGDADTARTSLRETLASATNLLEQYSTSAATAAGHSMPEGGTVPLAAIHAAQLELGALSELQFGKDRLELLRSGSEAIDLRTLFQGLALHNKDLLASCNVRLSLRQAEGSIVGDRGILMSSLNILLCHAIRSASGILPQVLVKTKQQRSVDVISFTFSGREPGDLPEGSGDRSRVGEGVSVEQVRRELCLAIAAAEMRGGDFSATFDQRVWNYCMTLPSSKPVA